MQEPAACIFDLDGVIVDTAHYHFKAWQRLAELLSVPFTEEENKQLKGLSRRKSIQKILDMGNKSLPEKEIKELMEKKNGWYQDYISKLGPANILPGVSAFLDELEEKNIPKGIGSSSKNAKYILESLELTDRFGAIIDGASVEQTKPHPEVFLKGAQKLGVQPSDCIVFEDAASGVKAANRGGMWSVGVGDAEYLGEADAVISSFNNMTLNKILTLLKN